VRHAVAQQQGEQQARLEPIQPAATYQATALQVDFAAQETIGLGQGIARPRPRDKNHRHVVCGLLECIGDTWRDVAATSRFDHQAIQPCRRQGAHHGAVIAQSDFHQADPGVGRGRLLDQRLDVRWAQAQDDLILADPADAAAVWRTKGIRPAGVHLANEARRMDLVIEHDHAAASACSRTDGNANRGENIAWPVGAWQSGIAHGACDDQRHRQVNQAIEYEGGLFDGVRTLRDHDALAAAGGQLAYCIGQRFQIGELQVCTG